MVTTAALCKVMHAMNSIVKLPQLAEMGRQMAMEMDKAGLIDEVMEDAFDVMEDPEVDEEAETEATAHPSAARRQSHGAPDSWWLFRLMQCWRRLPWESPRAWLTSHRDPTLLRSLPRKSPRMQRN